MSTTNTEPNMPNNRNEEEKTNELLNQYRIYRVSPILNNPHKILINEGYIPYIKNTSNIRILNINPNGLRETADLKIQQLTQSISKHDLDIIILNETNCK